MKTPPLNNRTLEAWMANHRASELSSLKERASRSGQRAEGGASQEMLREIARAFGVSALEADRAFSSLKTDLLAQARSGRAGFTVYAAQAKSELAHGAVGTRSVLRRDSLKGFASGLDEQLGKLTDGHRFAGQFPPPRDIQASRFALRKDLREVPVLGANGRAMDVHQKIASDKKLAPEQKERILSVLAEVRDSYLRLEAETKDGYQIVNWKHTRGEIDQVLEAARLGGLDARQTEDAMLASIFSDAVKTPKNFITHNVDGAKAAAEVLSRYLDPKDPAELSRIAGIVQAIKEHQIGPPSFMAQMLGMLIKKNSPGGLTESETKCLEGLTAKVRDPFAAPKNKEGSAIELTAEEKTLLARVGVEEWTVPYPGSEHYLASRAVIDGDSLINYASPDGWAKLVAIRGPGTFFQDSTVWDSLASAKQSYDDAILVVSDRARPLAEAGLRRTEQAVERVRTKMEAWISELAKTDEVPVREDGTIAYWSAPLAYGEKQGSVHEAETAFAGRLRSKMVELLRAEQGVY